MADSDPAKSPPAELVFGRYQIIRRLAVGGMGEVFLARQSGVAGFDRLVILKSLLPDLAGQDDFVDQFLDEARVAATLNHPNIVSIYEVGLWNGTYFIAMEYIRGDNLSRLQRAAERSRTRLPIDVAAFIVHHAAQALDHAHQATDLAGKPLQIVHRDVSPQNIMVRTDGVTKVVDFGIAKAANRSSRTATGTLKGKVQYMAPEQVHAFELDGRADQFALGVVLWEMLAGRKLFQGNNEIEILRSVVSAPIPVLKHVVPDLPDELSRTVERMLMKDRDARYPSLHEAANDLKKFLDVSGLKNAQERTADFIQNLLGAEISAKTLDLTPSKANNFVIQLGQSQQPATSPTRASAPATPPNRTSLGIAAGVVLAVLLSGLAFVGIWLSGSEEPPSSAVSDLQPRSVDGAPTSAAMLTETSRPSKPMAPRYLLDSTPSGAEVREGTTRIGTTPLDTEQLTPDVEHEFVVALSGHEDGLVKVKLRPGETYRDKIVLKTTRRTATSSVFRSPPSPLPRPLPRPLPSPPPNAPPAATKNAADGRPGMLTLNTSPWGKAYIDGKYVDSTPIAKLELSAGTHSVRIVNEAIGVDISRTVKIAPGEHLKQNWTLK